RLRSELKARASARPSANPFIAFFTMPTNKYLVPGLAVLAIAVAGALSLNALQRPAGAPQAASDRLALAGRVTRAEAGAFGPLSGPSGTGRAQAGGGTGLGGGAPVAPETAAVPMGGGGSPSIDSKMLVPTDWTPTVFKHVYKGEAIEGLSAQVDVYRRERGGAAAGSIGALLGYDLGLMNLGAAKNGSIQSFNIAEDRENGYVISVNPEEGTINIYENYLKWNYPERSCTDQACIDSYRLKEGDMIADDEAIRVADAFLAEYGVSKDGYGAPVVRDDWRVQYARMSDKSSFWFPDTVTVVYPVLVDGKPVYDEGGAPNGLNVNVNVRHKRASGLWNLATRNLTVSAYEGETDPNVLLGVAEKGGVYGDQYMPENAKVVEVELGTPTVAFTRVWQWNGTIGTELTVPALVFPVLNAPQDYWRTNVTVPLAKELLKVPGGGVVMPLGGPEVR
ncbi:MAG TPA: hypothetical protein VJ694_01395, partial [Patescibacteria group bacterium]|nr:hypothetical protein [Patescibacteria group bacterium]